MSGDDAAPPPEGPSTAGPVTAVPVTAEPLTIGPPPGSPRAAGRSAAVAVLDRPSRTDGVVRAASEVLGGPAGRRLATGRVRFGPGGGLLWITGPPVTTDRCGQSRTACGQTPGACGRRARPRRRVQEHAPWSAKVAQRS